MPTKHARDDKEQDKEQGQQDKERVQQDQGRSGSRSRSSHPGKGKRKGGQGGKR